MSEDGINWDKEWHVTDFDRAGHVVIGLICRDGDWVEFWRSEGVLSALFFRPSSIVSVVGGKSQSFP